MASTGSRKRRHKSSTKDTHVEACSASVAGQPSQHERKLSRREQQQQQQQQQQEIQQTPKCKYRPSSDPAQIEKNELQGCDGEKKEASEDSLNQHQLQQKHVELKEISSSEMEMENKIHGTTPICASDPMNIQLETPRALEKDVQEESSTFKNKTLKKTDLLQKTADHPCTSTSGTTQHGGADRHPAVSEADSALTQNSDGKTRLLEAIKTENFLIVKALLDECSTEAMVRFYKRQLQLLSRTDPAPVEQEVKLSLVSLLAVVSRLQGEHRVHLAKADPVGPLMSFIKSNWQSKSLVSMVCVLLGMLLWDSSCPPWQQGSGSAASSKTDVGAPKSGTRSKHGPFGLEAATSAASAISCDLCSYADPTEQFLRTFIQFEGPEILIDLAMKCTSGEFDLSTAVSVLLPVMAMSTYDQGQAWLAENSDSIVTLSEILSTKSFSQSSTEGAARSSGSPNILTDLNLGSGMSVAHVIQAFLAFLSQMEIKDKEQNSVGPADEAEDDEGEEAKEMSKKEKRRKKRQRKNQSRQLKAMAAVELEKKRCNEKGSENHKRGSKDRACSSDEEDGVSENVTNVSRYTKENGTHDRGSGAFTPESDACTKVIEEVQLEQKEDGMCVDVEGCANEDFNNLSLDSNELKMGKGNNLDLKKVVPLQVEGLTTYKQLNTSSNLGSSCNDKFEVDHVEKCEAKSLMLQVFQEEHQSLPTAIADDALEMNDGWVKVSNKKQGHQKSHGTQQRIIATSNSGALVSDKVLESRESSTKYQPPLQQQQQHLRWADVARMGCSFPLRENLSAARKPFSTTQFPLEIGKPSGESFENNYISKANRNEEITQLPTISRSSETAMAVASASMSFKDHDISKREFLFNGKTEIADESEIDEDGCGSSKWQQVARQVFAVNIKASKEALEISVTSGGETDEEEDDDDTTSSCSECPIPDFKMDSYSRQRPQLPSLPVTPVGSVTTAGLSVRSATSDTVSTKKSSRSSQKRALVDASLIGTATTPRKYFSAIEAHSKSSQNSNVMSPPLAGGEGDQQSSEFYFISKNRDNTGVVVKLPSLPWASSITSSYETAKQQGKTEKLDKKEYFQMPAFVDVTSANLQKYYDSSSNKGCEEEHRYQALADLANFGEKPARVSVQKGLYFNEDARNIPAHQNLITQGISSSTFCYGDSRNKKSRFLLPGALYEPNNSTNCSQLAECSSAGQAYSHDSGVTDSGVGEQSYAATPLFENAPNEEDGEQFMPSFSQMAGAVDENPIVTSVVETVFTLSSNKVSGDLTSGDSGLTNEPNEETVSEKQECTTPKRTEPAAEAGSSRDCVKSDNSPSMSPSPSPPPGFQFAKLPPVRKEKATHCVHQNQALMTPTTSSSISVAVNGRDETPMTQKPFPCSSAIDKNFTLSLQSLARTTALRATAAVSSETLSGNSACQLVLPQPQSLPSSVPLPSLSLPGSVQAITDLTSSRLPVVGVVNPFSKQSLGRWDCTNTITSSFHQSSSQQLQQQQQKQQQQQLQQQQLAQQQLQPLLQPRFSLTGKLAPTTCHSAISNSSWLDKLRLVDASATAAVSALATTGCDIVPLFTSSSGMAAISAAGTVSCPQMNIFRPNVHHLPTTNNTQLPFAKCQQKQQQQQLFFLQHQQQQHQQLLIQQQQHMHQRRLEAQSLQQKQQQQQLCPSLVSAGGILSALGGIASTSIGNSVLAYPPSPRRFTTMRSVSKHFVPSLPCLQQTPMNPFSSAAAATTSSGITAAAAAAGARSVQPMLGQPQRSAAGASDNGGNLLSSSSPPILFPSDLRDDQNAADSFHGYDDLSTPRSFQIGFIAESMVLERLVINQIRQQFKASLRANSSGQSKDSTSSALKDSVLGSDLDYYASLYRVKLRDLLLPATGETPTARDHDEGIAAGGERPVHGDLSSRRWRDALSRILDTPWTKRQQYGDIILPSNASDFNISLMEYPLLLGFTTDGYEVAVLELDKSEAYIDPCLLEVMSDPDLDRHFILKCKGASETRTTELVAYDLCDYTLAEYIQIVHLSQHQDPLSASRLAWQLLEAVKFVHQNLGIPHGNLKPSWIFVDGEGKLRLGGCGITTRQGGSQGRSSCWASSEELNMDNPQPSMASDIQVAGMLLYFILTGGQHPFGGTPLEAEVNIARSASQLEHIGEEANDLVSGMLFPDPVARPAIEHCLKHPFFWSNEKKFRLILIVGSDVLTEMKTGVALTGSGSPTMMEILSVINITDVSPNWVQAINPVVMKEMRSFRVYKNSLSELTLFIYNCCLHFDKISSTAKEVLDDPCRYFLNLFPCLFMSIYRSLKASDRTDRSCFKPFF